jgi:hypothetical protein
MSCIHEVSWFLPRVAPSATLPATSERGVIVRGVTRPVGNAPYGKRTGKEVGR